MKKPWMTGVFSETKRVGGKKSVGVKFEAVKQDR